MPKLTERVARLPWPELHEELDARGFAQTAAVLSAQECRELAALYEDGRFRSTIAMAGPARTSRAASSCALTAGGTVATIRWAGNQIRGRS